MNRHRTLLSGHWTHASALLAAALLSCNDAPQTVAMEVTSNAVLSEHTKEFRREVIEVTEGVHVAVGYGLANSIMIEGDNGLVIVDTMESIEVAREVKRAFRKISAKPIVALIYTHNHTDHVFGSAGFTEGEGEVEIYAHVTTTAHLDSVSGVVQPIHRTRSARMFGSHLEGEALENAGIGPLLALTEHSHLHALRPTKTVNDRLEVTIAGVELHLVHAPGETDDQLFVWLPKERVLLPGDNLYRTFPNLYTIRGTSHRDVTKWYRSLDQMRALSPEFVVPSHTRPLSGEAHVQEVLRDYRDAIQYVHDQTVRWMNAGLTPDEIVLRVKLPAHLRKSPFLQEFYGTVPWSVRSIFSGYLGWFDGNPTNLRPLSPGAHADKLVQLAGGRDALQKRAREATEAGEHQWALELTDALLALTPDDGAALAIRAKALRALGAADSNPNSRHYYLTSALEAEGLEAGVRAEPTAEMVHSVPIGVIFQAMTTRLNAEAAGDDHTAVNFIFPDLKQTYSVQLRGGVAEVRPERLESADVSLTVDSRVWKEVAAKLRSPADLIGAGGADVEGNPLTLLNFLRYFLDA